MRSGPYEVLNLIETMGVTSSSPNYTYDTFQHNPYNGTKPTGMFLTEHRVRIYSSNAVEFYDDLTRSTTPVHSLSGIVEEHIWKGNDWFGNPMTDVHETVVPTNWWYGQGDGCEITCGSSGNAFHHVTAVFMGDPVSFPEVSGRWDVTALGAFLSDPNDPNSEIVYRDFTAFLSLVTSVGSITCDTSAAGDLIGHVVSGSGLVRTELVGKCSFNVVCHPKNVDGTDLYKAACIVVEPVRYPAGTDVNTVAFSTLFRNSGILTQAITPFSTTISRPTVSIATRITRSCSGFGSSGPPDYATVWVSTIDDDVIWHAPIWSGQANCRVYLAETAVGKTADSNAYLNYLDNLGDPTQKVGHQLHPASNSANQQRAIVQLPSSKAFPYAIWTGSGAVGAVLTSTGTTTYRNDFGNSSPTYLGPYRWLRLRFSSDKAGAGTLNQVKDIGGTLYRKKYAFSFTAGANTVYIDMCDPYSTDNILRENDSSIQIHTLPNFIDSFGATSRRFSGGDYVESIELEITDCVVTFTDISSVVRDYASLRTHAAINDVGGGIYVVIDGHCAFQRMMYPGRESVDDILDDLKSIGATSTHENFGNDGSGWNSSQAPMFPSTYTNTWVLTADQDLLVSAKLLSTALTQAFVGYWGMCEDVITGGDPVVVRCEYTWGRTVLTSTFPNYSCQVKIDETPSGYSETYTIPVSGNYSHQSLHWLYAYTNTNRYTMYRPQEALPRYVLNQYNTTTFGAYMSWSPSFCYIAMSPALLTAAGWHLTNTAQNVYWGVKAVSGNVLLVGFDFRNFSQSSTALSGVDAQNAQIAWSPRYDDLHIVYQDSADRVYTSVSGDRGDTWSDPVYFGFGKWPAICCHILSGERMLAVNQSGSWKLWTQTDSDPVWSLDGVICNQVAARAAIEGHPDKSHSILFVTTNPSGQIQIYHREGGDAADATPWEKQDSIGSGCNFIAAAVNLVSRDEYILAMSTYSYILFRRLRPQMLWEELSFVTSNQVVAGIEVGTEGYHRITVLRDSSSGAVEKDTSMDLGEAWAREV